jgi:hypothetical protein
MTKKQTLEESLGGIPSMTGAESLPPVPPAPIAPAPVKAEKPKAAKVQTPDAADFSGLTEEDKAELRRQVQAELAAEAKAEAAADFKAQLRAQLIMQSIKHAEPSKADDAVDLRIDLARHVPYIRIDNTTYYPGYTYTVSPAVAQVLKDQMYRSFLHDAELLGLNINDYFGRQQATSILSGKHISG